LRVIGGELRGRRLLSFKGDGIRPTSDRVKESLFNIISGTLTDGIKVADLFAGTGNLGIEALSRGAGLVFFVEKDKNSVHLLRQNLAQCGLNAGSRIIPMDVLKAIPFLEKSGERFDIIFLDPPYGKGLADAALEALGNTVMASGALVVAEHDSKEEIKERYGKLKMEDKRRYGLTALSFFKGDDS